MVGKTGGENAEKQAIRELISDTLSVESENAVGKIELNGIELGFENNKLQLKGKNKNVLSEISLPSDKYITNIILENDNLIFTFSDDSSISVDISLKEYVDTAINTAIYNVLNTEV